MNLTIRIPAGFPADGFGQQKNCATLHDQQHESRVT